MVIYGIHGEIGALLNPINAQTQNAKLVTGSDDIIKSSNLEWAQVVTPEASDSSSILGGHNTRRKPLNDSCSFGGVFI